MKNSFNFGPVARTDAGRMHDTINLVSLPLHVMLNALVGSTSTDEFIAWLWHDLYKPAFQWVSTGKKDKDGNDKLNWYHTPGCGAFSSAEKTFAATTGIGTGLVSTHHDNKPNFTFRESDFISDQVDQVNLGAIVNYIQLSIASEPALPTVLVRSIIANAFIEVVAKDVAESLRKGFIKDGRTPIDRVQFEFKTTSAITFGLQPTDKEIWDRVGQHFDMIPNRTFIIRHLTPVTKPEHEQFATTFTADLTGEPLLPDELLNNTISLAELLVSYQDSRTVIIAVPQAQLYTLNPQKVKQATLEAAGKRLDDFNVLTVKNSADYLQIAFDTQIDIREVPGRLPKRPKNDDNFRPLTNAVLYPSELLAKARKSPSRKVCRLTGTPFTTDLIPMAAGLHEMRLDKLFSSSFVDTEFVGIRGSIAPLAYPYIINTHHKSRSLRGSFALIAPASRSAIGEQGAIAKEIPPLDKGGRFSNQLNRITVTTQEFTLFQQMSRRIIAGLWRKIVPNEPLPLPYLGAILLTHDSKKHTQQLLPHLDSLFSNVLLKAYPFELKVQPAVEIALEAVVQDAKHHHTKHTLLKTTPCVITAEPKSVIPLLVDDDIQVNVSQALFNRIQYLTKVAATLKRRKKKVSQKEVWLKLILSGSDPLTAVFESAQATTDTRKLPEGFSLDTAAFQDVEDFWDKYIDQGDIAQSWAQYEKLNKKTTTALEEFPALPLLMQALQKSNEEGTTDDPIAT